MIRPHLPQPAWILATGALVLACESRTFPNPTPTVGQTEFISADARGGRGASRTLADGPDVVEDAAPRSVEQGDVYRVAGPGRLFNLNPYRGLQILDIADPAKPRVLGDLRIVGTPIEMYVLGSRALVLLNDWNSYRPATDAAVDRYEGGLVVLVDVSDETNPVELARARVPGGIRHSRLTRGNGQDALFVVAEDGSRTTVKSFALGGGLVAQTELDLGGSVTDIQATPDRLLVARAEWGASQPSQVAVIDISDPSGAMREGASIPVKGFVAKKSNLDLRGNILRVVSGNSWTTETNTNHVETFDVSDLDHPVAIDHATFGDGENLFGTLFMADRAFFVTYLRQDPFHAFSISPDGQLTEVSEFVVSGWNDWFRPVANDTRLIGIGVNDERGRALAVSLYDVTDLANPAPMIARAEIDLDHSWSEGSWDDRGFTVLEGATSARAASGELETGLVLLPFHGYSSAAGGYEFGVEIFTFSERTLTRRGRMAHERGVNRSFLADAPAHTAGNLSDATLSLFDVSSPDSPAELGRLDLAPSYNDVLAYGGFGVRRRGAHEGWRYPGGATNDLVSQDLLEIFDLAADPDRAPAIVAIPVPSHAAIHQVGDRLAVVSAIQSTLEVRTKIDLYDLTLPVSPLHLGALDTNALEHGHGCGESTQGEFFCQRYGSEPVALFTDGRAVGDALVFRRHLRERALLGVEHHRFLLPEQQGGDCTSPSEGKPKACSYVYGGTYCVSFTGADGTEDPEVCSSSFQRCEQDASGNSSCGPVDPSSLRLIETRHDQERYREWQSAEFQAVDLRGAPSLGGRFVLDASEDYTSELVVGAAQHISFRRPFEVPNDPRSYHQSFFRTVDWSNPLTPSVGPAINIPGELVLVDGDTLLTRDAIYTATGFATTIDKLEQDGGVARLVGIRTFAEESVDAVLPDGAGRILVGSSEGRGWDRVPVEAMVDGRSGARTAGGAASARVSVLDLAADDLPIVGAIDLGTWGRLAAAVEGRAIADVSGGLLVLDLDEPSAPAVQAFLPMNGWARELCLSGRDVLLAAGRHGLYRFGLDVVNAQP